MAAMIPALFMALALSGWAGPASRLDRWKTIGPGGAGGMFLPTISPHDPNVVLEHCDMTGAYLSLDAGRSWRMFNLRGVVSSFAFDPKGPKVIYAGNQALWKSSDTGRTWRMVFPDPRRNTMENMRDDHAEAGLTSGDPAYPPGSRVSFIAPDPADSMRVYIALRTRAGAWLCATRDGGATWSRLKELPGERVLLVYFDQGLHVVTESGVVAMRGQTWESFAGPAGARLQSASGGSGLLYATAGGSIYISRDRGRNWQAADIALPQATRFTVIACSARHPRTAYAAFVRPGKSFGIARASDAGRHWAAVYEESGHRPAPNVERAWIEDFYGGTGPIVDLGVSPTRPEICYATDSCPRSFRTLDGGRSWQQIVSARVGADRWATTGFDVTTCYGVHFDPFEPRTRFISYTDVGLFKSSDGGTTWKSSIAGIPRRWRNTTYWVEFDPQVKGLLWGAFARTHDLPRPKMWRRADPDTFEGGVGISTNAGEHWTVSNAGMPETAVTHIMLDTASPVGARALYACGFGRGVYKSTDNGRTWALKIAGIEKKQPFAWRIIRAADGTLYLVVSRRSDGGYTGDAEDGALYRSTDGAEHWLKMTLPGGTNGPTGLALDPRDNRRMYLSSWGVALPDRAAGGGVFLSTDGGTSWKNIFHESQHVYDVTVDPRNPDILYNCGFETGAYRSADRGSSWTRIRGFNFKWGHRVIPDPADPSMIYITTFGGSVWHGPAAGDPDATEDIVP